MPRKSKGTRTNAKTKLHSLEGKAPSDFKVGFLQALDGRTDLAKALRANYDAVVEDVGGSEEVGHVKSALVERFCWLEAILQKIEHDIAHGKVDQLGTWIQATNSLSGLARVLGVDRQARARFYIATPLTAAEPVEPQAPAPSNGQQPVAEAASAVQ